MLSFRKFAIILFGSLLIAIGTDFYLIPFKVLDGGFIGIALIMNYMFGFKTGLVIIVCSIPIFIIAWLKNRVFFYNSLSGMLISSILIELLLPFQYHFLYYIELGPLTSSMFGGFLLGTGLGLMLRYEASTGGTDLIAKLLSKHTVLNIGVIIFLIDGLVIGMGGLLISWETFFYSVISISSGGIATSICTLKGS
ncbi:YitT family protein [Paenibacillus sp. FA6]|uniref:YitT family protein n=1 Tax=Paenibacillus sp. FA6 TaxID=3413029 RepID=UPI003F65760E